MPRDMWTPRDAMTWIAVGAAIWLLVAMVIPQSQAQTVVHVQQGHFVVSVARVGGACLYETTHGLAALPAAALPGGKCE